MQGVRILQLDVGLLLAGSRDRGTFEQRISNLLSELKAAQGKVILVIDEIHSIVGAGAASPSGNPGAGLDLANLLKPALAAGLRCIGATTVAEHRKRIAVDPALDRRFQPVTVAEPTHAQALVVRPSARTLVILTSCSHRHGPDVCTGDTLILVGLVCHVSAGHARIGEPL